MSKRKHESFDTAEPSAGQPPKPPAASRRKRTFANPATAAAVAAAAAAVAAAEEEQRQQQQEQQQHQSGYSSVYQGTPVGASLMSALNTLIRQKTLTFSEAKQVMACFDQAVGEVLEETIPRRATDDIHAEGQLTHYINSSELWKIEASDVTITAGAKTATFKRVRFLFE
jgi:hypothetical protein